MNPTIIENLNEEQKAAVLARDGAVLIVAGAGSGKTRVLTSRIALLMDEGVAPQEILALTFTKKAAGEMRERIRTMTGPQASRLVMGTFHSVFIRFLREYHDYIGFPASFTIYDEDDSASCLKGCIGECLFGVNWNDKEANKGLSEDEKKRRKHLWQVYKIKDVASRISRLKNEYITPKDYFHDNMLIAHDIKDGRPQLGNIYETYMKRCRKAAAMDYDDILVYMFFLLKRYPEIGRQIGRRFRYILVDEYQDTNAIQYGIIHTLASVWGNICVVGDDSQSIYAFRGARIENILNFRNDYPKLRSFKLETNYRSTPEIVNAANRLIEHNETRLPKVCRASKQSGHAIEINFVKNDREEARYISRYIKTRHDKRHARWSDHAVLYRTNAQARALEDAFIRERIPYVVYSGMSFFERQEVKDVIAYMRLAVNPNDDEAFKRVCNRPARGISDATLTTLGVLASSSDRTLYEAACDILSQSGPLKASAVKSVNAFRTLLDSLHAKTTEMDAVQAAQEILADTGIYKYYEDEKDDDGRKRANNIDELLNGVRYYVDDQLNGDTDDLPDTSLGAYLENIALLSAVDRTDDAGDTVSLMTSHCSKGLEFPTVFIAGVEEGLYPSIREAGSAFELEEERRLFYVSVTRAKEDLILTSCDQRWHYGQMDECEASRFLEEMFPDEFEKNEDAF